VGELLEVNGKNAVVAFGMIKTSIKLDKLERATGQQPKKEQKSTFVSSQTQDEMYEKKLHFKQDIDVRGMRGDEALQAVTYFVDDAIQIGVGRVRILHGTGTGILRQLIRQYLETVSGIAHFQDEHIQFGGAGITVVDWNKTKIKLYISGLLPLGGRPSSLKNVPFRHPFYTPPPTIFNHTLYIFISLYKRLFSSVQKN